MKVYRCLHCDKTIESIALPKEWAYCAGDRFICPECECMHVDVLTGQELNISFLELEEQMYDSS